MNDRLLPEQGNDAAAPTDFICDRHFIDDLKQLKDLRSFLIQQAVSTQSEGPIHFGTLNRLQFAEGGRQPYDGEWEALEGITHFLYRDLNDNVRRRFLYGQLPSWVTQTAIVLGVAALASLFVAVVLGSSNGLTASLILPIYTIWLAGLGAIGSIAFIGMNALAVQSDVTFDMTNRKLIVLRIVLGALFGIVLTLPFGFESFNHFLQDLGHGGAPASTGLAVQSILLLLPFILGFSTSLVIMILNQFVEAVQIFFGKKSSAPNAEIASRPAEAASRPPAKASLGA